ncbi:hypothetical protein C8Q76DRAFT_800822 [Earliella scabrosa]|nr:hypothetical protein C8Q76DRAFT_800822 [Earliella scabrosa]
MSTASLPPLTNTYGAVLVSSFVALGLYGVTVNQTVQYFRSYPADVVIQKFLVAALFITDTFHTLTLIHLCYHYLVSNYFSPGNLNIGEWSIQLMSATTGTVVIIAQSFYARRIYLVNPRYGCIVIIIGCLILVEMAFMIVATYHALRSAMFTDFASHLWLDSVLFCLATVTDLALLGVFIVILRTSRTSFRGTQAALDQLALYAVIGTLVNSALTLPAFVTSVTSPHTFLYIALAIPTTKIYSNSVLGFLNCRSSLAEAARNSSGRTMSISLSRLKPVGQGRGVSVSLAPPLSQPPSRSRSDGELREGHEIQASQSSLVLDISSKPAEPLDTDAEGSASGRGAEGSTSKDGDAPGAKHTEVNLTSRFSAIGAACSDLV